MSLFSRPRKFGTIPSQLLVHPTPTRLGGFTAKKLMLLLVGATVLSVTQASNAGKQLCFNSRNGTIHTVCKAKPKVWKECWDVNIYHDSLATSVNFYWVCVGWPLPSEAWLAKATSEQRISKFSTPTDGLDHKDKLANKLRTMEKQFGPVFADISPRTFKSVENFVEFYNEESTVKRIWIAKPANQNLGRGIFLLDTANLTPKITSKIVEDRQPYHEPYVVQEYIDNPLLIGGYKFDIRLYVCISSWNPLTVWLYDKGIVRFSSIKYTDNISESNLNAHLTNSNIHERLKSAKDNKDVIGVGIKWSLKQLYEHLQERCGKSQTDIKHLKSQIEEIVALTCCSVLKGKKDEPRGFEMFGFDILLDNNYKPWLIEVNADCSTAITCDEHRKAKLPMLTDLLTLVGFRDNGTVEDTAKFPTEQVGGWSRVCPLPSYAPFQGNPIKFHMFVECLVNDIKKRRKSRQHCEGGHPGKNCLIC